MLEIFGKKSAFLGQKQCFLGKKCTITWYILHISPSYFCKFAITRKNDAFDAKIVNTRLTKIFSAIFAPDERLPSSDSYQSALLPIKIALFLGIPFHDHLIKHLLLPIFDVLHEL